MHQGEVKQKHANTQNRVVIEWKEISKGQKKKSRRFAVSFSRTKG
jgi:hypothetical protein